MTAVALPPEAVPVGIASVTERTFTRRVTVQGTLLSKAQRRPFPHNNFDHVDSLLRDMRDHHRRVVDRGVPERDEQPDLSAVEAPVGGDEPVEKDAVEGDVAEEKAEARQDHPGRASLFHAVKHPQRFGVWARFQFPQ